MRKRVRKQLEATRKTEREQYRNMLERSHRLDLETAQLRKALHISDEENKRLKTMFEQLQAESDTNISALEVIISGRGATIDKLTETIDELKRPWWYGKRWWQRLIRGMQGP